MKIVYLVGALLCAGCGTEIAQTAFVDCDALAQEKALFAIGVAKQTWSGIDRTLDELTVVCHDNPPRNNNECVFDWYGVGIYMPGTVQVEAEYIGECLIEKSQHFKIWQDTSYVETCSDHAVSCGWNESETVAALKQFWAIYPQANNES